LAKQSRHAHGKGAQIDWEEVIGNQVALEDCMSKIADG